MPFAKHLCHLHRRVAVLGTLLVEREALNGKAPNGLWWDIPGQRTALRIAGVKRDADGTHRLCRWATSPRATGALVVAEPVKCCLKQGIALQEVERGIEDRRPIGFA
ncbi:MAG: hypothetical protein BWZ07_01588 [Alphaproteobacteria bacterium ADurb.BinA280]|nr:MAG: hypothetical protein BWZ07_01588 [Alphaproteobacteria bacterium ADurb.BinA280]